MNSFFFLQRQKKFFSHSFILFIQPELFFFTPYTSRCTEIKNKKTSTQLEDRAKNTDYDKQKTTRK